MKVYLNSRKGNYKAQGEYDPATKQMTVLKGSMVSQMVTYAGKFRGAVSIDRVRDLCVRDRIVIENHVFSSASTAANFVTGVSTNGLQAWKTEDGVALKEAIS